MKRVCPWADSFHIKEIAQNLRAMLVFLGANTLIFKVKLWIE